MSTHPYPIELGYGLLSQPERLCVHCEHADERLRCKKTYVLQGYDPVDGVAKETIHDCRTARANQTLCGTHGRWFSQVPAVLPTEEDKTC